MDESILFSVKKLLGIYAENTDFDTDIILHINAVLAILQQLGVGPEGGFAITGYNEQWSDLLGSDSTYLNQVQSYVYMKVRLLFDPPVSSAVSNSLDRMTQEFEWRINVAAENHDAEEAS